MSSTFQSINLSFYSSSIQSASSSTRRHHRPSHDEAAGRSASDQAHEDAQNDLSVADSSDYRQHSILQEENLNPSEKWVIFSPGQAGSSASSSTTSSLIDAQEQKSNDSSAILNHSISLSSIHLHSMPSHDGRGRFSDSGSSNHPIKSNLGSDSDSDSGFDHVHHPNLNSSHTLTFKNQQTHNLNSDQDHDQEDFMSIPESISIDLSNSIRSSTPSTHLDQSSHSNQIKQLSQDDLDLILTPMASSAGLAPHQSHPSSNCFISSPLAISDERGRKLKSDRPNPSSRHSSLKSSTKPPTHSNSHSSPLTKPIIVLSSCSNDQSVPIIPRSNQHSDQGQVAIRFVTTLATKLMHLDSETLKMLASNKPNGPSSTQISKEVHQTLKSTRLLMGDGDNREINTPMNNFYHSENMISPPMDLSGFVTKPLISHSTSDAF
ncbi:hypothetical protein O181_059823 [Austropuccinia psidii MF-1]|uniref:Uncharacterized protein n=1 Tax=Austropuccinia psidii MF-1 TaxID=1389203 RepID=A0A9Q3EJJ3_9BASI|nr:hypothetical protein [Austropuccinia psidii MF-1]